jgi:hypothetical protein|tara:strand:+ start:103 stop:324 length:222 start_codon:yes stop_codon:yes gene_type:complete
MSKIKKEITFEVSTKKIESFDDLNNIVDSLLAYTNEKMTSLIQEYNELPDVNEIDTVDLDSKFDDLTDYVNEY